MPRWIIYALLSSIFAGATAIVARLGLSGISAELGLAVRTTLIFAIVSAASVAVVPRAQVALLTTQNVSWLAVSALLTALSWLFYFKALKLGNVGTVALIDKGSVLVALVLAVVVLHEPLTPGKAAGAGLILAGLILIARSP